MDAGDLIFYGLIAISAVASIVKSVKKKGDSQKEEALPDFKGDSPAKWLQTIIEDKQEEDDEFIPVNPKQTIQAKMEPVAKNHQKPFSYSYEGKTYEGNFGEEAKSKESFSSESRVNIENYRRNNQSLEKPLEEIRKTYSPDHRKASPNASIKEVSFMEVVSNENALSPSEELRNNEELKKAIIYGEIMRTKF